MKRALERPVGVLKHGVAVTDEHALHRQLEQEGERVPKPSLALLFRKPVFRREAQPVRRAQEHVSATSVPRAAIQSSASPWKCASNVSTPPGRESPNANCLAPGSGSRGSSPCTSTSPP